MVEQTTGYPSSSSDVPSRHYRLELSCEFMAGGDAENLRPIARIEQSDYIPVATSVNRRLPVHL